MKYNLSRRTKIIGGIVIGIMLILSGTVFALGKTEVISIGTLADTVIKTTKQVVTPKGLTSSARITLALPENIPSGATIVIKNTTTGNIYSQAVTDPGNNIFTNAYTFNNIAPGHYEGDESKCVRVYPFNVSADDTGGYSTGEILASCATNGGGTICGDKTCSASERCATNTNYDTGQTSYFCVANCTANSCPTGQRCDAVTKECVIPSTTPPPTTQKGDLKLTVHDKNGNLANIQYSITECYMPDCSTGGIVIARQKKTNSATTGPNASEALKIGKGYEIDVNTETGGTVINPNFKKFVSKIVFTASTNVDANLSSKKVIISGQTYNLFPDGTKQYISRPDLKLRRGSADDIPLISHDNLDFPSSGKFSNWHSNAINLNQDVSKFTLSTANPFKSLEFEINDSNLNESMYDTTLGAYIVRDKNLEYTINQYFAVVVKDKKTAIIAGADVKLDISSCNYSKIIPSDTNGKAMFALTNCEIPADPQLIVSKPGYTTSVTTFDSASFAKLIETDHQIQITLKASDTSSPFISGKIVDIANNNAPLGGATVQLLINQAVTPSPSPKETKSDASGSFMLTKPKWTGASIISTFKDGYTPTTNSKIFFNLSPNEKYEFNLALSKKVDLNKFQYPVLCLDRITLKPIPNQTVDLYENNLKVESRRTDVEGRIVFSVSGSAAVKLSLKYQNKDYQSSFTVPADPTGLSLGDRDKLYSKGIFILGSAASTNGSATIALRDKESGRPVVNATVTVILPFSAYLGRDIYADNWVKCQSDERGYVHLPEDLQSSRCTVSEGKGISTRLILNNFAGFLSNPTKVWISASRAGYKDYDGPQMAITPISTSYTAEMVPTLTDEVCVDINNINIFPDEINAQYIKDHVEISNLSGTAKYSNANVTKVDSYSYNVCFSGIPSGHYYATFTLPSGKVQYNDVGTPEHPITYYHGDTTNEPTLLKITICEPGFTDIYTYNNNIFFVLTDSSMKNWYKQNEQIFKDASFKLFDTIDDSNDIGPTAIYLSPGAGKVNGEAMVNDLYDCGCGKNAYRMDITQSLVDFYINNNHPEMTTSTVLHEYGHLLYETQFLNQNSYFSNKWKEIWEGVSTMGYRDTFFELIKDSRFETVPADFGGHPADNEHEMFASFFNIYYNHHTELLAMIKARKENSDLQNILAFMWQIFGENVGTFEYNDADQFPMVGELIGKSAYTFQDIRTGKWRPAIFNTLPIKDKITEAYRRVVAPVLNLADWGRAYRQILTFNSWLSRLLANNPSVNTAHLSGKVTDQKGNPVKNTIVIFGGSYAAKTDLNGSYDIPNILTGNFSITVKHNNRASIKNLAITSPIPSSIVLTPKQNKILNIQVRK